MLGQRDPISSHHRMSCVVCDQVDSSHVEGVGSVMFPPSLISAL